MIYINQWEETNNLIANPVYYIANGVHRNPEKHFRESQEVT